MEPAISIIMPLYNAERFLEETLVSVSRQTFQNYELICIDDGSVDNSVSIVHKFQDSDPRINLFRNKKHSGAAVARNKGIKVAKGKYLIFLDGDDIFDEDLLELAYQKAENTKAEIVISEIMHVPSESIYDKRVIRHSEEYRARFCQRAISVLDIKLCDFMRWPVNICGKLFQREFIRRENLEFQNLPCENDTYFIMMAFFLANRVVWLDSGRIMLYAREHDTVSRISSDRDPMCIYYAMIKVRNELKKRNIFAELFRLYCYKTFFFLFDGLKYTKTIEKRMEFCEFVIREGFDKLLECSDGQQEIDSYIQEKWLEFIHIRMGNGWEKLISFYDVFLEDNLREIESLFYRDGEIKRVGVWGTGNNGSRFLAFCKRHSLPVAVVIDSDRNKQGQDCEGYCIQSPKDSKETDIVISTPNMGYEEIKKTVHTFMTATEVIDINAYICYY